MLKTPPFKPHFEAVFAEALDRGYDFSRMTSQVFLKNSSLHVRAGSCVSKVWAIDEVSKCLLHVRDGPAQVVAGRPPAISWLTEVLRILSSPLMTGSTVILTAEFLKYREARKLWRPLCAVAGKSSS